jgi:proteic killer suppression protein
MIRSYLDKDTEEFAAWAKKSAGWDRRRQAEKRLRILDSATSLGDLAALDSNRLELSKGNRRGQYSNRINDQWRICFWAEQGWNRAEQDSLKTEQDSLK